MKVEFQKGWFVSLTYNLYPSAFNFGPYVSEEEADKDTNECKEYFKEYCGADPDRSEIRELAYFIQEDRVNVLAPVTNMP